MKKFVYVALVLAVGAVAFIAGGSWSFRGSSPAKSSAQTTVFTCPMHPQYKQNHPGDCPICGMRLVPMGADTGGTANSSLDAAGMVVVSAATQQLIGVRTDEVRRSSSSQVLRVPGRIAVDDQRLHRIIAAAEGWIVELGQNTVGRFVKKDQFLASYYTKDLLYTERLFLLSTPANEALPAQEGYFSQASIRTSGSANPLFPIDSLRGLGMSDLQIDEIHRTRTASPKVNIYSPVSGFILARSISPTQRFDKGTEFYRIADLSHVWALAGIFETDSKYIKPGAEATILYQGRRLKARMTDVLPQFDEQSRTLKTRFELDNPGYLLQPDMFVDVEINVEMPPAITVPADALFDSGLRKTVFVDRGNGNFEARRVETGWRMGGNVEIVKGLMEGERIVGSANFLLDSESRMRAAFAGIFNPETDPVCGMEVDQKRAVAAGRTAVHEGQTYYFCSDQCKRDFEANPGRYLTDVGHAGMPAPRRSSATPSMKEMPAAPQASKKAPSTGPAKDAAAGPALKDPVCGMNVDVKEATAAGRKSEYQGKTYYFCADECKKEFDADPAKFVRK